MGTVKVPETILREAKADPIIGPRVILRSTRRVSLMHGDEVIGFVTPHETPSGWRAGPIYVTPAHRGHGHLAAFYAAHAEREWAAFVPHACAESLAAHQQAGFHLWKRSPHGVWLRKEAAK